MGLACPCPRPHTHTCEGPTELQAQVPGFQAEPLFSITRSMFWERTESKNALSSTSGSVKDESMCQLFLCYQSFQDRPVCGQCVS